MDENKRVLIKIIQTICSCFSLHRQTQRLCFQAAPAVATLPHSLLCVQIFECPEYLTLETFCPFYPQARVVKLFWLRKSVPFFDC